MSVAVECVRDKMTRKHVIKALSQHIRKELKELCSRHIMSIQRSRDPGALKSFSWDAIVNEAAKYAPTLIELLTGCTMKGPKTSKAAQKHMIGVCLSLLCKYRNPKMTLFQRMLSLILYAGHSAKKVRKFIKDSSSANESANLCNCLVMRCILPEVKIEFLMQVYTRLHKLHLCASHRDTITSLDILGKSYDTKVMQWSNTLTPRITLEKSVSNIMTYVQ